MPELLLIQQLLGPILLHLLMRPVLAGRVGLRLPRLDEVCGHYAAAFVRAVGHCGHAEPEREEP